MPAARSWRTPRGQLKAAAAAMGVAAAAAQSCEPFALSTLRVRVCGDYCGPGWCSGRGVDESECSFAAVPASCADRCCMAHDWCCAAGLEANTACNQDIVDCLAACDPAAVDQCMLDNLPVAASAVATAFEPFAGWCCGSPCAGQPANLSLASIPLSFLTDIINGLAPQHTDSSLPWLTPRLAAAALGFAVAYAVIALVWLAMYLRHHRFKRLCARELSLIATRQPPTREELVLHDAATNPVTIELFDVGYTLPDGTALVSHVTASLLPGQFTALIGPSGAGKTTLLDVLACRKPPCGERGRVLVNGVDRREHKRCLSQYMAGLAYLMQLEDTASSACTVFENLAYAAFLQLAESKSEAETFERVNALLHVLHLNECAHVRLGSRAGGGASGGQRRRLALAVQMLSFPSVLLLDEPTSGLDPASALDVMTSLKSCAKLGCTVLSAVQQPRAVLFALFDRIVLMYKGSLALLCTPSSALDFLVDVSDAVLWKTHEGSNPSDLLIDFLVHATPSASSPTLGAVLVRAMRRAQLDLHPQLQLTCDRAQHSSSSASAALGRVELVRRQERSAPAVRREAGASLRGFWLRLWVLESRFLRERGWWEVQLPPITCFAFGAVFGVLYFNSELVLTLASCLFLGMKATYSAWVAEVVHSTFCERNSRYWFEMSNRHVTPWLYLVQHYVHFAAFLLIPTAVIATAVYCLPFSPLLRYERYLFLLFFYLLDALVALGGIFFFIFSLMHARKATLYMADQVALTAMEASLIFTGFYIPYAQVPWVLRWGFYLTHTFDTFRALCLVALQDLQLPRTDCDPTDAACAVGGSGSGNAFLALYGYDTADAFVLACSLFARGVAFALLNAIILTAASYDVSLTSKLRQRLPRLRRPSQRNAGAGTTEPELGSLSAAGWWTSRSARSAHPFSNDAETAAGIDTDLDAALFERMCDAAKNAAAHFLAADGTAETPKESAESPVEGSVSIRRSAVCRAQEMNGSRAQLMARLPIDDDAGLRSSMSG